MTKKSNKKLTTGLQLPGELLQEVDIWKIITFTTDDGRVYTLIKGAHDQH